MKRLAWQAPCALGEHVSHARLGGAGLAGPMSDATSAPLQDGPPKQVGARVFSFGELDCYFDCVYPARPPTMCSG